MIAQVFLSALLCGLLWAFGSDAFFPHKDRKDLNATSRSTRAIAFYVTCAGIIYLVFAFTPIAYQ